MNKKWIIGLVGLAAVIIIAIAVSYKPATAPALPPADNAQVKEPVKIGLLFALTGDGAVLGVPQQRAVIMAQEEINAAGGIGGQQVEVVAEDAQCGDASSGASAAQKLVSVDKVKVIFGGSCSSETIAAVPITNETQAVMMSSSATNPALSEPNDYFFRTVSSDAGQGQVAAQYAYRTFGARKAAVISEQTDYAQALAEVFKENFTAAGGAIAVDEVFQSSDTDVRAQVLKVKASGAELVYLVTQTPATTILVLKQIKSQELAVKVLGGEVTLGRELIDQNKELLAGVMATELYFDETAGPAADFLASYETRYGEKVEFPGYITSMYSQMYLIKAGMEAVGNDATKLKDWLSGVKGWKHALGELTFDENGDRVGEYAIKEVQADGSLKELSVVKPQ